MLIIKAILVAFSMYTVIPMPATVWDDKSLRYVFIAFPLVGAVIGGAGYLLNLACGYLGAPRVLWAALFTILPVALTGGIHLDGYADTWDALSSHASPEKKQEILKDPHLGAFAVIRLCTLFLLVFALWAALPVFDANLFIAGEMLCRVLTGITTASFPMAKNTGLLYMFTGAEDKKLVKGMMIAADLIICVFLVTRGGAGIIIAAVAHLVLWYYYNVSKREFGGISGDTAGWFIVECEKLMLFAVVLFYYIKGAMPI